MDSFHPCVSAGKRRTPLPDLRCAECSFLLERVMGIEPTPTAWKAVVLAVILHPRVSAIRYYHINRLFVKKFLCFRGGFGKIFSALGEPLSARSCCRGRRPRRPAAAVRTGKRAVGDAGPYKRQRSGITGLICISGSGTSRLQRGKSRSSCRRQPSRMSRYAVSKSPVYQGSSISRSSSSGRSLPAGSPPVMRRILRRFQASI